MSNHWNEADKQFLVSQNFTGVKHALQHGSHLLVVPIITNQRPLLSYKALMHGYQPGSSWCWPLAATLAPSSDQRADESSSIGENGRPRRETRQESDLGSWNARSWCPKQSRSSSLYLPNAGIEDALIPYLDPSRTSDNGVNWPGTRF